MLGKGSFYYYTYVASRHQGTEKGNRLLRIMFDTFIDDIYTLIVP